MCIRDRDTVIGQSGDVANVLEATMTTIRGASVTPANEAWGFVVDGSYQRAGATGFATAAGGFVGSCESAVLGSKEGASKLSVNGLRGVSGGKNAGGFVGLADVGSVADVGGTEDVYKRQVHARIPRMSKMNRTSRKASSPAPMG